MVPIGEGALLDGLAGTDADEGDGMTEVDVLTGGAYQCISRLHTCH